MRISLVDKPYAQSQHIISYTHLEHICMNATVAASDFPSHKRRHRVILPLPGHLTAVDDGVAIAGLNRRPDVAVAFGEGPSSRSSSSANDTSGRREADNARPGGSSAVIPPTPSEPQISASSERTHAP
jgi:hypothetical protein